MLSMKCMSSSVSCVFLAAMLSACGSESIETEDGQAEAVGESTNALSTVGGGELNYPTFPSVRLMSKFRNSCFLTGIGGRFEGGAEFGQVFNESGAWVLRAGSDQVCDVTTQMRCPVFVAASCVNTEMSHFGTWTYTPNGGDHYLRTGGTCFLTRVMGKFVGGGEYVRVVQNAKREWHITGGTGTNQAISASAGCVDQEPLVAPITQWGRQDTWSVRSSVNDPDPTTKACFLQGVQGGMRGAAERVSVSNGPSTNWWYLNGQSSATSSNRLIGATMGCIGGPDPQLPL
jgi:hypothetical protein